jgi:hypothetical protein
MFDFGIAGYQPRWLRGLGTLEVAHGERLAGLTGRTLSNAWLVWALDSDRWMPDWPVLLDFDGEQVEINHQKTDDVSITYNTIIPSRPIRDFECEWRSEPLRGLRPLPGQQLHHAQLLECPDDTAVGEAPVAVGFTFTSGYLAIYNAGDENGLLFQPLTTPSA